MRLLYGCFAPLFTLWLVSCRLPLSRTCFAEQKLLNRKLRHNSLPVFSELPDVPNTIAKTDKFIKKTAKNISRRKNIERHFLGRPSQKITTKVSGSKLSGYLFFGFWWAVFQCAQVRAAVSRFACQIVGNVLEDYAGIFYRALCLEIKILRIGLPPEHRVFVE